MRYSTGRWVSGDDFFNRDTELQVLKARVRDGNHTLLTGQRRMGKTSIVQKLGRCLEQDGWTFLFADVEGATCPEDFLADIVKATHTVRSVSAKIADRADGVKHWFGEHVEEVGALAFRMKFRAGLNAGNWRRHGETVVRNLVDHDQPVLLVVDELPIFLTRMLRDHGAAQVEEFLSWLRGMVQGFDNRSPVLIVSGSIGLAPLVQRLGISDRVNHLDPFRLEPWSRNVSVACFDHLVQSYGLQVEEGVSQAVFDTLGLGIPHHVQSFFARLREFAVRQGRNRITVADVELVYRTSLLSPQGQNDLVHYETRLKDGLDEKEFSIAMEILAEASTQDMFTPAAQRCLEQLYAKTVDDARGCVMNTLGVLMHDGYLEVGDQGHTFPSRLLKDWWTTRFRDYHIPLQNRVLADT